MSARDGLLTFFATSLADCRHRFLSLFGPLVWASCLSFLRFLIRQLDSLPVAERGAATAGEALVELGAIDRACANKMAAAAGKAVPGGDAGDNRAAPVWPTFPARIVDKGAGAVTGTGAAAMAAWSMEAN